MSGQSPNTHANAYSILIAEFLFILFPFVVSGIVFSIKGSHAKLFYIPEWSLAASILIGQSLIKFISGILANHGNYRANWERVALALAFLIVFCFAPSLIILCFVLYAEGELSFGLAITQIVVFFMALVVFFFFGAGGEALMRSKRSSGEE
jgi:hypothetical protein